MKVQRVFWSGIATVALFASGGALYGQTFQELYAFKVFGTNGDSPQGALIQASDGNFYGTTFYGGEWDFGTVFKMTPEGELTTLASFDGITTDQHPVGSLVEANDGNFYGGTDYALFRVTRGGELSLVGCGSVNGTRDLLQSRDDYLYGASARSGAIFWTSLSGPPCEGVLAPGRPSGGLIQARDGKFYGLTGNGGTSGWGTAYQMSAGGAPTVLASFPQSYGGPRGRLLETGNGEFLGFAGWGYYGAGAVFKITSQGVLTTVASFNFSNGENPVGGLIQGNDGNFYGTTRYGGKVGSGSVGTVFRMTPDGVITALVSFSGSDGPFTGANPQAGLVQGTDGNLYGTTSVQGSRGAGNIFRIIMPGPQLALRNTAEIAVLSWRTNYTGYNLQTSTDLNAGSWKDLTNAPAVASGRFWITNSAAGRPQFFRLKK